MFAGIHVQGIAASGCGEEFSPLVEVVDADTVVLDVSGLERLLGTPQQIAAAIERRTRELGLAANVAIASNPDAAILAARGLAGITVMASLDSLPVESLSPSPEILSTLRGCGIRTLRDLAALPEIGLAERFGEEGVRLQQLARGHSCRPLRPAGVEPAYEEYFELDYPVALLEPLSFVLSRLLHQLCERLAARALAAIEIRLQLRLENKPDHTRALRLPVPMRSVKTILKLLELDLNANPPGAPVLAVRVSAEPAKPRAVQNGLFLPPAPEPEKLELTLARIAGVVGADNVGSPELLDTYRPDAFRLRKFRGVAAARGHSGARRLAFRFFRPPLQAKVHAPGGRPAWVSAHRVRGRVIALAGPWRGSGEWWSVAAWSRDEWDVVLSDGALYRLWYDRATGRWLVEGSYD